MILWKMKGSCGSQSISPMLSFASLAMRERRSFSHVRLLEQVLQNVINSPSQAVKAGLSILTQEPVSGSLSEGKKVRIRFTE